MTVLGTQVVEGRRVVHERGQYELTLVALDCGAYGMASQPIDGGVSLLEHGILCARLRAGTSEDQAETLLDYLSEIIDCWEVKWSPEPPDGPGGGTVVPLRRAA